LGVIVEKEPVGSAADIICFLSMSPSVVTLGISYNERRSGLKRGDVRFEHKRG
jgi:hypothetical protein